MKELLGHNLLLVAMATGHFSWFSRIKQSNSEVLLQKCRLNTEVGCNDDNARRDDIISTKAVCVYDGHFFFPVCKLGSNPPPPPPPRLLIFQFQSSHLKKNKVPRSILSEFVCLKVLLAALMIVAQLIDFSLSFQHSWGIIWLRQTPPKLNATDFRTSLRPHVVLSYC